MEIEIIMFSDAFDIKIRIKMMLENYEKIEIRF